MDTVKPQTEQEFVVTGEVLKTRNGSNADELRYSLTPILLPNRPDWQGDRITATEIEKAVWGISLKKGLMDLEHALINDPSIGEPVEKYVLPADTLFPQKDKMSSENEERMQKIEELQKAIAYTGEARLVPKGSGMLGVVWSEKVWKSIKSGEKTGLSIYGKGQRSVISKES
jgi:Putative phage serine protease XkdF